MTGDPQPKVAIWSADWTVLHGQARVTRHVVEALDDRIEWRPATYRAGLAGMLMSVPLAKLRLWWSILGGVRTVYLVLSRSNLGFIRDLPALFTVFVGCRVVAHCHGSDIVDLLRDRPIVSPVARFFFRRCEMVVPSAHLLPELKSLGLRRLHLCENFVDPGVPDQRSMPGSGRAEFTVLWNSNIMASKGFFRLTDAVAQVNEDSIRVGLRALGSPIGDAEMPEDEVTVRLDGLSSAAWFDHIGPVSSEVALAELAGADAVALPSRYPSECQPLAVIDAMCLGLPVILADTPALRATAAGYPAEFVDDPFVPAIAERLRALATAGTAPDLSAAAKAARVRFSAERFDRKMMDLLDVARA